MGTVVGLRTGLRLLALLPWLHWVPLLFYGVALAADADLFARPLAVAVLVAAAAGLVAWVMRSGRRYPGRSSRGDLGMPVPPLFGAAARTLLRLAVPTVVYLGLLRWPLNSTAPAWPGAAVGLCIVVAALGYGVVMGLIAPRFPCAVALDPCSTDGLLALGGRGNRVWLVRVGEHGTVVERVLAADSGLLPVFSLLTGEPADGPTGFNDWANRLTPGFVLAVCTLAGSDSRALLASGGSEGGVHLWDVETGQRVRALRDSGSPVTALCPAPVGEGTGLAVSDGSGVRVYDPSTWTVRWRWRPGRFCTALVGAATASGRWLVVGGNRGEISIHDADDGTVLTRYRAHGRAVSMMAVIRLGGDDVIVSCGQDGRIAVHELPTGSPVRSWEAFTHPLHAMTVTTVADRQVLVVGGDDPQASVWDPATGAYLGAEGLPPLLGSRDVGFYQALCALQSTRGSRVVGVGYSSKIFVLDPDRLVTGP